MAFRRNHISDVERLPIGFQVYQWKSIYEMVIELARKYLMNRWFMQEGN